MADSFIPLGGEFQVNTYTTNQQTGASPAALKDGGYIITWTSAGQDGSGDGVFAQRYDANGATVGAEFQVNTTTLSSQTSPSVTGISNGGFVVAWATVIQDGDGFGVFSQHYDANGNPVGGETQVNSYITNTQFSPEITTLDGGGYVVTWDSFEQDGDAYGIYGQHFTVNGVATGPEFRVNTTTVENQADSSLTAMADGGFLVTWHSFSQDGSNYGVYGQRYDASGVAVGAEFLVNTVTAGAQQTSSVAGLSGGGFVVAWESTSQDGDGFGIFAQQYDASGVPIGTEFQVNSYTTSDQRAVSVAATPDGGFIVVWSSNGQDGSSGGIYGQRYNALGETIEGEFQISTTTANDQNIPAIEVMNDGGFVVAWQSDLQDGDFLGMFAQQFQGQLYGTSASETISDIVEANWLSGEKGDDIIYGKTGDDIIYGGAGNDKLYGGVGNDELLGGNDNDKLKGGAGDDLLYGGNGKDVLLGGIGADVFQFKSADQSTNDSNADRIKDFQLGLDTIDLKGLVPGELTFVGSAGFSGTGFEVNSIINPAGNTVVRADVDGDGLADFKIVLSGSYLLSDVDFIL